MPNNHLTPSVAWLTNVLIISHLRLLMKKINPHDFPKEHVGREEQLIRKVARGRVFIGHIGSSVWQSLWTPNITWIPHNTCLAINDWCCEEDPEVLQESEDSFRSLLQSASPHPFSQDPQLLRSWLLVGVVNSVEILNFTFSLTFSCDVCNVEVRRNEAYRTSPAPTLLVAGSSVTILLDFGDYDCTP